MEAPVANTISLPMKTRVARRVVDALLEQRGNRPAQPGGSQVFHHIDETGMAFTVAARGDVFEVHGGNHVVYAFPVDARAMLRLGWWIVWTWWVRGTWCGLKTWLWRVALRRA